MHAHLHTRLSWALLLLILSACANDSASIGLVSDSMVSASSDQFSSVQDSGVDTDIGSGFDGGMAELDAGQAPTGPSTIQRIQQGILTDGTSVTVTGAVVTAITGSDGFFISDGTDLPFSGIYVYHPNTQSLGLSVSDTVTLVGVVKEYFDLTEIAMNEDAEVLIEGTSFVPDAVAVDPEVLCDAVAIEPWEGTLISVDNVVVQSVGEFGGFIISTRAGGCEIDVNPLINPIDLGRLFSGQNIARVTGILHYAYESFQLLPRSSEDVITVPLATGVVSIPDIRDGDIPLQSRVSVHGVTVLAVDDFFVYLGDVSGGPRSALRVTDRQRDTEYAVGDRVDVDVMVLSALTARMIQGRVIGQSIGPAPSVLTQEQLQSEDYLYGLVSVSSATVVNPNPELSYVDEGEQTQIYGNPKADFELNLATVGNEFFRLDNSFLRTGDGFESITGVQMRHTFDVLQDNQSVERIVSAIGPRQGSDFVGYQPTCDADVCVAELQTGDLVITEISYGGECEWIEIKNTRTESVDLTHVQVGERLSMTPGGRPFTFGNEILDGGSLAVVGCAPSCGETFTHFESNLGGALANDGDTIEVWAGELTLDTVTYRPGRTDGIQLVPDTIIGRTGGEIAAENDDSNAWCDAVTTSQCGSIGTPGKDNQCSATCAPNRCAGDLRMGDILITELMADPVGGSTECEWIELYNTTDQVIELAGLLIADGSDPNLFRAPNLTQGRIEPRGYAVVMRNADECANGCSPPSVASWQQFASLNNDADTITVAYQDRVIHRTSYRQASVNGASIQRLNLNDNDEQWCAAIDGMDACAGDDSTPNQPNACF